MIRTVRLSACLALVVSLIGAPAAGAATDPIDAAVGSEGRPAEDVARDADRRPADVLRFFELEPGQRVVDLMGGRGYYTEIVARAVGPNGKVWIQNNPFVVKRFADEPLRARMARLSLPHLQRIDSELDDPKLPGELDLALLVLFYHDTYWQGVDRAAMNRAVLEALRPGGIYAVVDHHAEPGSGERDVETLHRVDAVRVREEIEAAGFVLEAESALLRHPEDDRTRNVFEKGLRGRTDRFVYRFRKPVP